MSKTCLLCHIVFATKNRIPTIPLSKKDLLYGYIRKVITNNSKTKVLVINGTSDHVHILIDLHPTTSLASLLKSVKQSTTLWMSNNPDFPKFSTWGKGYFASSVSPGVVDNVIGYIVNQEEHHHAFSSLDEIENLIKKCGLEWHPDDLQ